MRILNQLSHSCIDINFDKVFGEYLVEIEMKLFMCSMASFITYLCHKHGIDIDWYMAYFIIDDSWLWLLIVTLQNIHFRI